jgi:hypothetical protein
VCVHAFIEHETTKPSQVNKDILPSSFLSSAHVKPTPTHTHTQFKKETCPKGTSFLVHPTTQGEIMWHLLSTLMHTFDTITHQPRRFRRNTATNDNNNNNTSNSRQQEHTTTTKQQTRPSTQVPVCVHAFMEHQTTKPSRATTHILNPSFLSSAHLHPHPHPHSHTQFKKETCPKGTSFKAHLSNTRRKHVALTFYIDAYVRHPTPTAEVSAQPHQRRQQQQHVKQSKSHHYNQTANTAINTSPRVCACIHGTRNNKTLSGEHRHTFLLLPLFRTRHTHTHTRSSRKKRVPKVKASKHTQATQGGNMWHLQAILMHTFDTIHTNRGGFGATPSPKTTTTRTRKTVKVNTNTPLQ